MLRSLVGSEMCIRDSSVGDTLTYTITATNSGTAALTNVVINDSLITPNTTTCALVASGDTCVLTGTYVVTAADITAGEIINTASGNSDQTNEMTDDNTQPLNQPALDIVKPAPVLSTDADGNGELSVPVLEWRLDQMGVKST